MDKHQISERDFWTKALAPLIRGHIIRSISLVDNSPYGNGDVFVGLRILAQDGKLKDLLFLSDEEGNGAGRFQITDVKESG